jgi:hypothetical protein
MAMGILGGRDESRAYSGARADISGPSLFALASSCLYSFFYFFFYSYRRSFADRPGEASA